MHVENTYQALEHLIRMQWEGKKVLPPILWGPPGVGKSERIAAFAERAGAYLYVAIASLREPVDFGGFPRITAEGDAVDYLPLRWVQSAAEQARKGQRVLIFLDELSTAPPAVQKALLRMVLEKVVGDHHLPKENIAFAAAANPPELAVGGYPLEAPLANRFVHLEIPSDPVALSEGWLAWASKQGPGLAIVAAFIRRRPELLLQIPKERVLRGRSWPSPRTWASVGTVLDERQSISAGVLEPLVLDAVGRGAGQEFLVWYEQADLPDPESILAAPREAQMPTRQDQMFALCGMVVAAATQRKSKKQELVKRLSQASEFLARITRAGYPGVVVATAQPLAEAVLDNIDLFGGQLPEFLMSLPKELLEMRGALRR
jgi:hypothetical protein